MSNFDLTVFIIEPDFFTAKLYWNAIDRLESFRVSSVCGSGEEALKKVSQEMPNIILISIHDVDLNYLQLTSDLLNLSPKTEILAVVDFLDGSWTKQAMVSGVSGILFKTKHLVEIERAIKLIAEGGAYLSPAIIREFVETNRKNFSSPLSLREIEVLNLLTKGYTYTLIANELNISKETARSHMKNIYAKLSVSSRAEAISKARDSNII